PRSHAMRHATHFLTITTIIIAAVMLSACTANTGTESDAPAIATVGGAEFDTVVLASSQPVVVDFYADWCGPCKIQAPILASVGQEFADQVHTLKVDIDAEPPVRPARYPSNPGALA
ncbi:MAG: thioredoxin domain-containing protein, partial [Planctomycetota bacterium]|nr:thioredoxin domain-containing protein [Planctomycetota bacterium]